MTTRTRCGKPWVGPAPTILATDHAAHPGLDEGRSDEQGEHFRFDLGDHQILPVLRLGEESGPLVALIPLGVDGLNRLESAHRLLAALHGRAIPPDTRLTRQQRARARRMLQAADGARDGATQQDIAQVIFHIDRLSRDDWQDSSVRHAVKSLLRDARAMIAGGYRKLLRHQSRP